MILYNAHTWICFIKQIAKFGNNPPMINNDYLCSGDNTKIGFEFEMISLDTWGRKVRVYMLNQPKLQFYILMGYFYNGTQYS